MDPEGMVELANDSFWPDDARHILQIPLQEGVSDFTAWHYDNKGQHSVRNAYKLQVQLGRVNSQGNTGSSTAIAGNLNECVDPSWKQIRKLPCPRKIQMFTWRLKHESLAFRTNLIRRGMKIESTKCLLCGCAGEDGAHFFIKCKSVKAVWRALGLEKERQDLEEITSVHVMLDYLWGLHENKRVQILTMWWHWWNNRNKVREAELAVPSDELTRRVLSYTMEYLQIFSAKERKREQLKWHPPSPGTLKVNMDGGFRPGEGSITWGVVVRDDSGDVISAWAGRTEQVADPFGAEVVAFTQAISTAAELGALRVVFETDSKLLQEALDLGRVESSPYAALIEDSKFQLKMWFSRQQIIPCNVRLEFNDLITQETVISDAFGGPYTMEVHKG
ncbi:uncharacterized protein [Aegilops tauschii subsp. strangulata]|uniref:uncharacterized protein n=1 Tax=Aegilops tauschii subsp. strangulata TaxID=200361 RepID=UPI003CC85FD6